MFRSLVFILTSLTLVYSGDVMISPREMTLEAEKLLLADVPDMDAVLDLLGVAAGCEDAYAQAILGDIYYHDGIDQDTKDLGLRLLIKSTMNGNGHGELWLAECYMDYKKPDYIEIVQLLERSAEKGLFKSYWHLGMMNMLGIGVPKNLEKCLSYLSTAGEGGCSPALVYLGKMYYHGDGAKRDYARALDYFLRAYAAGEKEALVYLGLIYKYGLGVNKDTSRAKEYFLSAIIEKADHYFFILAELRGLNG